MNHVDITQQSPVIISLCPGIRGLERGLERVFQSVRVAAYVEIEAFIVENLLAAMEAGLVAPAPVWTNLKTFNPLPFRSRIDGITGGYPCQPFSAIGKQQGVADPRHLWPYILDCFRAIRPFFGFFENVANHLNIGYRQVRDDLERLGYTVKEGIYTAEEAGAPHLRERLFFLAVDNTFSQRLEGYAWHDGAKERWKKSQRPVAQAGIFPAGQGRFQYEFEPERTVESGLVHSVNGYGFLEDLHRAIGNSVVEQTAEIAFLDLLRKHYPEDGNR